MVFSAVAVAGGGAHAAEQRPGLRPCHLPGAEHDAWCGSIRRPLDPAQTQGRQIDVHFAVLPALARNRKPDPVFLFAGGPGQSAIDLAGTAGRVLQRLSNRRDIVLIDQRGTGRSAPLRCRDEDANPLTRPLADMADPARETARLRACAVALQALPHGDLRHYTTWVASQDVDAVRRFLGAAQINLVGGSYGTRAALDYLRQFSQAVRRAVLDGVAPPDMVLPASFAADNQAALDAVLAACAAEAGCRNRYPQLGADWQALLAGLPRTVRVAHPVTGNTEALTVTRDMVLGLVRAPLYAPALAAALPLAITDAARGRFEPLLGLATAGSGGRAGNVFEGMHFSVVCAEDVPRLQPARAARAPQVRSAASAASARREQQDSQAPQAQGMQAGQAGQDRQATQAVQSAQPGRAAPEPAPRPGADDGNSFAAQYRAVCADWPRGVVPAAFYAMPASPAAVLLLSGGADPVTPPRHGARAAAALGPKARHAVVAQAGHGVMSLPCMRDVIFRFIDAASDADALQTQADCARAVPRPPAFLPLAVAAVGTAASAAPGAPR